MKESQKTVYKCDHCGKNYLVKRFALRHESFCKKKPENMHKCFEYCEHLIKGIESYTTSDTYPETPVNRVTFQCAKTGNFMYSFMAEKLKIVPTYNDYDAVGRTYSRMPLECDLYKDSGNFPFLDEK